MSGRRITFTDAELATIRERRASGEKLLAIACDYGCSEPTIAKYCRDVVPTVPVAGPHHATPYLNDLLTFPPLRWTHARRYPSGAYARGAVSELRIRYPHVEWDVVGAAAWMRRGAP